MVKIHCNIPRPLCHYIANRLTSATICLSYLSDDVYLSRAYSRVTVPLPPTPSLAICQSVYSRDCPPSYYLLRILCKPCAFQLIITLQLCSIFKRTASFYFFSHWCLAPRSLNLEVFDSVHQSYYYNNCNKIDFAIREQHNAAFK